MKYVHVPIVKSVTSHVSNKEHRKQMRVRVVYLRIY